MKLHLVQEFIALYTHTHAHTPTHVIPKTKLHKRDIYFRSMGTSQQKLICLAGQPGRPWRGDDTDEEYGRPCTRMEDSPSLAVCSELQWSYIEKKCRAIVFCVEK
jgi:hypothetical protein